MRLLNWLIHRGNRRFRSPKQPARLDRSAFIADLGLTRLEDRRVLAANVSISLVPTAQDEGNTGGTTQYEFQVTSNGSASGAFDINFTVNDGTATDADDFDVATASPLSFSGSGSETKSIFVDVSHDLKFEADETFSVTLVSASGPGSGNVNLNTTPAIGTINNDDTVTLTITAAADPAAEGTGTDPTVLYTVTASGEVEGGFTVALGTTGDAEATDFNGVPTSLTFDGTAADLTKTFTLTVVADSIVEADETVTVTLGAVTGTAAGVDPADIITGASASTNIVNDDTATLTLSIPPITETNADQTVNATVTLSAEVEGGFDLAFTTALLTAEGTDITFVTASPLSFAGTAGEVENIELTIKGDTIVEADETFTITLGNVSGTTTVQDTAITTGDNDTGTIINEDTAAATITIANVTKNEGNLGGTTTAFDFVVTLDNQVQGGLTIAYTTNDGVGPNAATLADLDYQDNDGSLNFLDAPPNQMLTITVNVVIDTHYEGGIDEIFTVALGALANIDPTAADDITIQVLPAVGTILNDDTPTLVAFNGAGDLVISDEVRGAGKTDSITVTFDTTAMEVIITDPTIIDASPVLGEGNGVGTTPGNGVGKLEVRVPFADITTGNIILNLGGDSDGFSVTGDSTTSVTYTPDVATTGKGIVSVAGFNVEFNDTEMLDAMGHVQATVELTGGTDDVTVAIGTEFVAPGSADALRISGTTGGTAFTPIAVWNNASLSIDTKTGAGNDTVSITGANNGHLITNLTIEADPAGSNLVDVQGPLSLPGNFTVIGSSVQDTATGSLTIGGIASFDAGTGNNVSLDSATNDFMTFMAGSGNNIVVFDQNGLILGTSSVDGTFSATALTGDLSNSGTVFAGGDVVWIAVAGNLNPNANAGSTGGSFTGTADAGVVNFTPGVIISSLTGQSSIFPPIFVAAEDPLNQVLVPGDTTPNIDGDFVGSLLAQNLTLVVVWADGTVFTVTGVDINEDVTVGDTGAVVIPGAASLTTSHEFSTVFLSTVPNVVVTTLTLKNDPNIFFSDSSLVNLNEVSRTIVTNVSGNLFVGSVGLPGVTAVVQPSRKDTNIAPPLQTGTASQIVTATEALIAQSDATEDDKRYIVLVKKTATGEEEWQQILEDFSLSNLTELFDYLKMKDIPDGIYELFLVDRNSKRPVLGFRKSQNSFSDPIKEPGPGSQAPQQGKPNDSSAIEYETEEKVVGIDSGKLDIGRIDEAHANILGSHLPVVDEPIRYGKRSDIDAKVNPAVEPFSDPENDEPSAQDSATWTGALAGSAAALAMRCANLRRQSRLNEVVANPPSRPFGKAARLARRVRRHPPEMAIKTDGTTDDETANLSFLRNCFARVRRAVARMPRVQSYAARADAENHSGRRSHRSDSRFGFSR